MGLFLECRSLVDGAPLVVVAIESAANRKTGAFVQTYIQRADIPPIEAARSGADVSVCGDCIHRPALVREAIRIRPHEPAPARCYVNLAHGPRVVWDAWRRGRYTRATPDQLAEFARGKNLRLGTYGDPGAVDSALWWTMAEHAAKRTGYTHRWADTGAELRSLCMASVDSESERDAARAMGWQTFRVAREVGPRAKGEARCPASAEAGKRATCATCPIGCNGLGLSVTILDHGAGGIGRRIERQNRAV